MLSAMTSTAELAITKEEAESLAKASANVARHYDVPVLNPKTVDWLMLMQTLAIVYGTRIWAVNIRRQQGKAPIAPRPVNQPAQNASAPRPAPAGHVQVNTPGLPSVSVPLN